MPQFKQRSSPRRTGLDAALITNWDGSGVTSSAARIANVAAGFDLIGLGVIRNSDLDVTTGIPNSSYTSFSGQPVTPDDVLVKYTYIGDANLSGAVSFDDYVGMDNAFFGLIPNLGWATGDINFDGADQLRRLLKSRSGVLLSGRAVEWGGQRHRCRSRASHCVLACVGLVSIIAVVRLNQLHLNAGAASQK